MQTRTPGGVPTKGRALGCLPAKVLPGQPTLAGLRMMARVAPARLNRSHIDPSPQMFGNDALGDCTAAGLLNHMRAVATLGGYQVQADTDDAVRFYAESTGYMPGEPATDRGGVEVDVLAFAARVGIRLYSGEYFPLWGSVDPQDRNALALVMAAMGGVYLGVQLAQSDMNQIAASNGVCVLDTNNGTYGDPTPGSAGGHCAVGWDYTDLSDAGTVGLLTWGSTATRCTWDWLRSRIMEAHGLVWPQLTLASGLYPTGPDIDALRAQNAEFLTP